MEKLTITESPKKSGLMGKVFTYALCGALTFSTFGCGKTTQKDVIKQQKKVETISFQISHYIQARKELVKDFNKLLKYPKTDSNKNDINKSLAQIYEVISEYDDKIEKLTEDKLNAVGKLNKRASNLEVTFSPDEPLDPNRWDYLLEITVND